MGLCRLDAGQIRGVAFDLDGTLVDSRLDFAAIRREIGCRAGTGLLEHVAGLADPEAAARAQAVIERHEMAGAEAASWLPGAENLLRTLSSLRTPVAILTRNCRPATERTLSKLGIRVDLVLTREDCRPKPDPDGLLKIAAAFELPPSAMIYVGDFRFDIEAAERAGMHACCYRNFRTLAYAERAGWIVDHFDEMTRRFTC
jgi:HAD superfamily hydrolase (TIGR01509 family)